MVRVGEDQGILTLKHLEPSFHRDISRYNAMSVLITAYITA